jgi:hypothetical protein
MYFRTISENASRSPFLHCSMADTSSRTIGHLRTSAIYRQGPHLIRAQVYQSSSPVQILEPDFLISVYLSGRAQDNRPREWEGSDDWHK